MRTAVVTGGNRGIGDRRARAQRRPVADQAGAQRGRSRAVVRGEPPGAVLALEDRLARVVQVSAGRYVKGRVDPDRTPTGADFHRMRTYCDTKLANLLVLPLFARRWQDAGVTINAVHPGVIHTGLGDPGGAAGLLLKACGGRP